MATGGEAAALACLGPDGVLAVCSFLRVDDVVTFALSCKEVYGILCKDSPWLWRALLERSVPNGGAPPSSASWRTTYAVLHRACIGPSEKALRNCVEATLWGLPGGQALGLPGCQLIRAVPARSKLEYAHSASPLLAWSQLLECRRGLELSYAPLRGAVSAHEDEEIERSDNVGVALVRRCFPFGAPGTAVFGHPSLRYFEVAILPAAVAEEGKRQQAQLSQQRDDQLVAQQAQQQRERPCGVSVGLVESAQALGMLSNGLHLGWYSFAGSGSMQSVGYHGEAGRLFPGPADSRWAWDGAPFAPSFGPGDVVGCGVDLAAGLAFFTLNGAVVGAVVPGGAGTPPGELPGWLRGAPVRPVQALTLRRSQLAVGLQRRGDRVALNLGQERFRFDLGQCCCSG